MRPTILNVNHTLYCSHLASTTKVYKKKQSLFSKVNNQMGKEMESVSSLLEEMKANQIDLEDLPEW